MVNWKDIESENREIIKYNAEHLQEGGKQGFRIRNARKRMNEYEVLKDFEEIMGYDIISLTPYQFRVNNELDIYPTNKKYHILSSGKRGVYDDLEDFLVKMFERKGNGQKVSQLELATPRF